MSTPSVFRLAHWTRLVFVVLLLLSLGSACTDDTDNNNKKPADASPDIVSGDMSDMKDATADITPDSTGDQTDETPDIKDMPTDEGTNDMPDISPDIEPDIDEDITPDIEITEVRLDAVVPPRGPLEGATSFVIEGVGFTQDSKVFFGSKEANIDLLDGKLVGQTPAGTVAGPVNVKVVDPTYGEDTLTGGFTYTSSLAIDSVTPNRIPTEGKVEVSIRGRGFDAETRVSFGGSTALRHTLVDASLLRVVAPPHIAGVVDVRASNRDASVILPGAVTYIETLRLDNIRPASGDVAGGDVVQLNGSGFVPGMTVDFNLVPATVQAVDATGKSATVVTPPHPAGLVNVRIVTPAQDAIIAPDAFYYKSGAGVKVADVQPGQGPSSGGVDVTLVGAGLDAQGLTVTFDGQPATIVEQGPGHVTVTIPAHAVGSVDVVVDDGQGNADTLPNGFTYEKDLFIDRVMPATSDVVGGIPVTLNGEGFTGASRVLFGPNSATFNVVDDQTITATVPAGAAGVVDVVVERDGLRATFKNGFTYTETLQVFGLTPVRGSVAGNTYVEIRGRGFVGNVSVTFGSQPVTDLTIIDGQTLAVRTPPNMVGSVDVTVKRDATEVVSPVQYTYFNPGARFGGAWGSPINGAVNVTVYSTGGQPIENAFVMLSTRADTRYQGLTDAQGMVTLSGPDVYGDQTITAVAAGHSSATVQRVDAENITILLSPPPNPGMPPAGPQPAVFKGKVTGLDKLAEPGPGQFQMAIVYTTQVDPFTDNPNPGNGNVLLSDGQYVLNSRLGDLAVIALGGMYDNNTQTFKPLRMGIKRYLFASEGMEYTVDIDLNIALTASMNVKLNNAPRGPNGAGPDINAVRPWLDLGFEGVFGELAFTTGQNNVLVPDSLAPLSGVLADASYYVEGGAYTNTTDPPFSVGLARNIKDLSKTLEMNLLDVAQVTSPAAGGRPQNNLVTFTYNSPKKPDLFYVRIETPMRAVRWEAFLPGTATSIRLPDFPDFSNLPADQRPNPYTGEQLFLLIIGISQPGLDFNNFTYNDLGLDKWDAYSFGFQLIQL